MPTAQEIRSALRSAEQDRRKRREAAFMALVTAGSKAIEGQATAQRRKAELREQYERAVAAEDARLAALETAAGQAVLAATGGELAQLGFAFRESELRDLFREAGLGDQIDVADLRRWVRAARQVGNGDGRPSAGEAEPSPAAEAIGGNGAV